MTVLIRRAWMLVFTGLMSLLLLACAMPGGTGDIAVPTPNGSGNPVRGTAVPGDSTTVTPEATQPITPPTTPTIEGPTTGTAEPTTSTTPMGDEIVWNPSAEQVVIQYNVGGGFRMAPTTTEIADFTLYGDGFVVWAQPSDTPTPGFSDQVMTGQLTPEEMKAVFAMLSEQGVFGLKDEYVDMQVADAPSAVLTVNAVDESKIITVYPALSDMMPSEIEAIVQGLQDALPDNGVAFEPTEFTAAADPIGNIAEMPQESQDFYKEWTVEGITLAELGTQGQSVTAEQAQAIAEFNRLNSSSAAENGVGYIIRLMAQPPRDGAISANPPRA